MDKFFQGKFLLIKDFFYDVNTVPWAVCEKAAFWCLKKLQKKLDYIGFVYILCSTYRISLEYYKKLSERPKKNRKVQKTRKAGDVNLPKRSYYQISIENQN